MAGFCTAYQKAGIQRRVRIQNAQLTAAKVSNPRFRGKVRKFPRHFKGHFSIGNIQVRILPGQPASSVFWNGNWLCPRTHDFSKALAGARPVSAADSAVSLSHRGRFDRKSLEPIFNIRIWTPPIAETGFVFD